MKRRALLIGNSNGLSGVKLDLANYSNFLKREIGGKWFGSEISIVMNPTRLELLSKIAILKREAPDYAFVVFSGHGAYSKGTILELNRNEEYIYESELHGIAARQLLIYDCCRNVIDISVTEDYSNFSGTQLLNKANGIREMYDTRIMQAIEQQSSLYACSVGQSSYDTNKGGIYSNCFLSSVFPISENQFKLVGTAQDEATPKTTNKAWEIYKKVQTPDHSLPRCISRQQLIISINPQLGMFGNFMH